MIGRARRGALIGPALIGAAMFGAACTPQAQTNAPAAGEAPPWRLAQAGTIASADHLILTVPLDDPAALARVAAEIEASFGVRLAAEWPLQSIAVHCLVIDARGVADLDDLIARMRADPRIRTVQRMQAFETLSTLPAVASAADTAEAAGADPLLPAQTALVRLNAARAQRLSDGRGVTVGVVDSGIDAAHPDLSARGIDRRDFVEAGPPAAPAGEAHGTAVAALIGAEAGNGLGMVGVAPGADLVGLRACWQDPAGGGRCSSFSLARALNFAALNRIPVLNLSLGGPPDPLLDELVQALLAQGAVVVAAWGEAEAPSFPASVPGVIAAGGGPRGGLPAPEVDVISAEPGGGYGYVSGSSVATAHVAGVAALVLSARPGLSPDSVAALLGRAVRGGKAGARPMLDACEAVRAAEGLEIACDG
ncbi:MAG: S8 family serine peptidase [Pseudomonadota bacterium]|nr:S8 family serine peptidase [Pseudomonadota bacterium]